MKIIIIMLLFPIVCAAQKSEYSSGGLDPNFSLEGHKPEIEQVLNILRKRGIHNGHDMGLWTWFAYQIRYMPLRKVTDEYESAYRVENDSIIIVLRYHLWNKNGGMGYNLIEEKQFYPPIKR